MQESKETILDTLNNCYTRLQQLNILPTRGNLEILLQTLYELQDVYKAIEGGAAEDGRQPANTE